MASHWIHGTDKLNGVLLRSYVPLRAASAARDRHAGFMVKEGEGVLTLAAASQQDWRIDQGGLTGSAESFGVDIAIGVKGGLTFDQTRDATFAGALSGTGKGAILLTARSGGSQTPAAAAAHARAAASMRLALRHALGPGEF